MLKESLVRNSIFCKAIPGLIFCSVLLTLLLISSNISFAQNQQTGKNQFHVLSDKMVASQDKSMVEFSGNVKVTRQDEIITAGKARIFFNTNGKEKDTQNRVKKIVLEGNVQYTAGKRQAFADKAVYTAEDEILILTGESPKLKTGTNFVSGKKITLFRKQDKVVVEGSGKKRVEALFNPEEKITN